MTRRLLLTCVALLLALTGCAATPAAAPGAALDFTGTAVDGAAFDAAELVGTPVVLWFWAPF